MADARRKKVLVAPLDWGLGHATRCVPIIRELLAREVDVVIASSAGALKLLQQEFPQLPGVEIVSYKARYSSRWPFMIHLFFQLPWFLRAIAQEHKQINTIVSERGIDLIISDNRYGGWSTQVPCVFITHQVNIILPWYASLAKPIVDFFNHRQIKKFTHCWVPDWPDGRLSKRLTRPTSLTIQFIGPLSRMKRPDAKTQKTLDVLALISGPEPRRTEFELLLRQQLSTSWALAKAIESAHIVIARSGYSTIMDLIALQATAILVPTPGQTEQEFLAEDLSQQGIAFFQHQAEFDLKVALNSSKRYPGFAGWQMPANLLTDVVESTLEKLP
ncbi:MAG: glycosyltransferase [Bacteroidota bacterium]